jgi:hypothetical protein
VVVAVVAVVRVPMVIPQVLAELVAQVFFIYITRR